MLVDFTLWTYLLILAAGIFGSILAFMRPSRETLKQALLLGAFLAVFDFVFENAGAQAGLWYSQGAPIYLLAVPIQVYFIALLAGMAFHLVLPARKDMLYIMATSLLIAAVGTGIESILLDHGLLTYAGGWTSTHAVMAYWATFMLMHIVNLKLSGTRVLHDNGETKDRKAGTPAKKKRR
jgi:hypothetical protein